MGKAEQSGLYCIVFRHVMRNPSWQPSSLIVIFYPYSGADPHNPSRSTKAIP